MGKITETIPKSLLPIGDSNIICRLISQLIDLDCEDITVVVGYKESLLREEINKITKKVKFVSNQRFKEDINILSLSLALDGISDEKFIVFEADCIYDKQAIKHIYHSYQDKESYWYSIGGFEPEQKGGILLSDQENKVLDIKIVNSYEKKYSAYNKLIGVLKVGVNESSKYLELIRSYKDKDIKQYYLKPWIDNLDSLGCSEISMSNFRSGAFNDLKEYNSILNVFADSVK